MNPQSSDSKSDSLDWQLGGTFTPFQVDEVDVVAPTSSQATTSDDGAANRKRKGAGGGRKGKAKIIRVIPLCIMK